MSEACFTAADILLPAAGVPLDPWACIAVDQFTSQPEYWQRAEHLADGKPSTLHIVLPEAYLGTPQETERLESIRRTMEEYRKSVLTGRALSALSILMPTTTRRAPSPLSARARAPSWSAFRRASRSAAGRRWKRPTS